MTKAQRKAYKADNRQRREVEAVLARLPDPRSKTSLRKRFDRLHAEWRAAVGLDEKRFTGPAPVLADSRAVERHATQSGEARESTTTATAPNGILAAGPVSITTLRDGPYMLAPEHAAVAHASVKVVASVGNGPDGSGPWVGEHLLDEQGRFVQGGWTLDISPPGLVCAARPRGPVAPPEGGGPDGVDDERNP
jgi:hypothetical protein